MAEGGSEMGIFPGPSMGRWEFAAKEQVGVSGREMTRGKVRSERDSVGPDLTESLQKTGQGGQMSPGSWWRMKNPAR